MEVKMNERSPSAEIIEKANVDVDVTASDGRVIKLKKPSILHQYRLIDALGESSKNEAYMAITMPLIYVVSIDGMPVPAIQNKTQLEALIQRLDEPGVEAVITGVQANFVNTNPEGERTELKN